MYHRPSSTAEVSEKLAETIPPMARMQYKIRALLLVPILVGVLAFAARDVLRGQISPPHAESETLEVIVLDAETWEPIPGAVVEIKGPYGLYDCPPTTARGIAEASVEVPCHYSSSGFGGLSHRLSYARFDVTVDAEGFTRAKFVRGMQYAEGAVGGRYTMRMLLRRRR